MSDKELDVELTLSKKTRRKMRDHEKNLTYKEEYEIPHGKRVPSLKSIETKTKTQISRQNDILTIYGTEKSVRRAIGEINRAGWSILWFLKIMFLP